MQYTRIPVKVEAEQYLGRDKPLPKGAVLSALIDHEAFLVVYIGSDIGKYYLRIGDWVITEPNGEQTICPEKSFKERYS